MPHAIPASRLTTFAGLCLLSTAALAAPASPTPEPAQADSPAVSAPAAEQTWDQVHNQLAKMETQLDHAFHDAFADTPLVPQFAPGDDGFGGEVDLSDNGKDYIVKAQLPDSNAGNIDVQLHDRVLRIQTRSEGSRTQTSDHGKETTASSYASVVQRALTLPGPVDSSGLQSRYANGVLTVTVPKAQS